MAKVYYQDVELNEILQNIPVKIEREINLSLGIVYRINEILKRKGWNKSDFAVAMGKKNSEISKWMSGEHNFTITTIAKIESVLGEDILSVKRYRKVVNGYDQLPQKDRRWLSDSSKVKYGKK